MTYIDIAPATTADGQPRWNIWAGFPAQRQFNVTVASLADMIAIATFLEEQGLTVFTDAHTEEQNAYNEGYAAFEQGLDDGLDDTEEEGVTDRVTPDQFAAAVAWNGKVRAHWARLEADKDYAQGVKEARRDAASYEHEQAWLSGQRHQL